MLISPAANSKKKRLLHIVLFFAVLFAIVEASGLRANLTPDQIQPLFDQHRLIAIVLFCLVFSIGNLLYVPGWVFLVAAVLALGKEWGGLTTYIAALTSCTLSYFLIRAVGGNALRSLENRIADKIFSRLDAHPIGSITTLRLLFQTVPVLNYALALSKVRFRHYLIGTLIGLPLPIFAYCYFFEYLFKSTQA